MILDIIWSDEAEYIEGSLQVCDPYSGTMTRSIDTNVSTYNLMELGHFGTLLAYLVEIRMKS